MTRLIAQRVIMTLMLGLTVFASALLYAEEIERRSAVSEIETSEFEKSLEERLTRDVSAYLGHEFFIIRADALLERVKVFDRTEEMVPVPQQAAPQPQPQPEPEPVEEEEVEEASQDSDALAQMELETEDGINQNSLSELLNLETPLPGLPVPDSVFTVQQQKQEQKQRQKKAKKKKVAKPAPQPAPPPPVKMEKKVTETLKDTRVDTSKLSMKVLLDEHINPEQEVFIRQLVIEKANLSFIRGDELQMLRSKFPGASVLDPAEEPVEEEVIEEPAPVEEPVAEETVEEPAVEDAPAEETPWWEQYWPYLAGAAALLLLALLFFALRRKPEPEPVVQPEHPAESEAAKKIEELIGRLNDKHDTITTNRLQAIREEVVSMAVEDFPIVKDQVGEWLNGPSDEGVETLASMHNLLGEGHFSSLFKSAISPDKMIALSLKAQEQLHELQAAEQLEMAENVYQTLVQRRYREQHNPEQSVRPFAFLDKLNDDQILFLLNDEGLKVKSLVFSQLYSDRAASLLKRLSVNERSSVATEISQFSDLPVSAFRDVANRLARKAVNVPSFANISVDGVDLLVDMLDYMDTADETAMLTGLRKENPELYYKIKQVYVGFNDLVRVPTMALKNILRETEREDLAVALFDTSDKFREIIYMAMLERPRAMLQSTLNSLENPEAEEIENAKREISRRARAMLKAGAFTMPEEPKAVKSAPQKPKGNAAA